MNGLPVTDQGDEHTPFGDAFAELDQKVSFGLVDMTAMNVCHTVRIVGALRLVEHDEVFRWHWPSRSAVILDIVLDCLNERLAAAASVLQCMLQDLHQWTVPRQVHGRGRGLAISPRHRQVVDPMGVHQLQSHQCLARPRNAA